MTKKNTKGRITAGSALTAILAVVALLDKPEVKHALARVSNQTKRWAEQIRDRRRGDGRGILSPLKPDHDASKLLFRLKELDAAAMDLASVDVTVSTEVRREVTALRAKVSTAHRLPKDVAKPKLKELALTIEQLETQIADALG